MRKILIFISSIIAFASSDIEEKIYTHILHSIFPNKKIIHIYIDDKNSFPPFHDPTIKISSYKKADILLLSKEKSFKKDINKPIFVNSYYLVKKYPNKVLGGFFWQKGRPNIIFLKESIIKYNIYIPKELEEFVDE